MKTSLLPQWVVFTALLTLFTSSQAAEKGHHSEVLDHLVAIQASLAEDSIEHVAHHATAVAEAAHSVEGLPHEAAEQAQAVAKATDLKAAREAFKKLSATFVAHLKAHPGHGDTYRTAYCPMAKAGWIQKGDEIANPYYGSSMLRCGSFED